MYRISCCVVTLSLLGCGGASNASPSKTSQASLVSVNDPPASPWHHRLPPQAALDACANLKAADACSFAMGDKTIEGA